MIEWKEYNIKKHSIFHHKGKTYLDVVLAFDTENTTFFKVNGVWTVQDMTRLDQEYFEILSESEKLVVPYIWQLAIDDDVIYGREIKDFFIFWRRFKAVNREGKAIIFVHNLGYDFEFICEYLPTDAKVFAKAPYAPMYADVPSLGLVFRCSYMLTNMSLEKCAKEYHLPVEKTKELDYTIARTPLTHMSAEELHYCECDVKVIIALIKEVFLKRYKNLADIPLTQTGEVRREVKDLTKKIPYYMYEMNRIKPDLQAYKMLTRVVSGGYTHLNGLYNGVILDNIDSYDKRSSYPDVMCTRKFPSDKWHKCNTISDVNKYAYIINVRLTKVQCKYAWAYISVHKCKSKNARCDNGKIYSADWIDIWCTEQDYILIKRDYAYESEEILSVYRSYKKYLPRELILYILKLFGNKTALKGLDDQLALYLRSKQLINSVFGLTLTNSVIPDIVFNPISHLWENPIDLTDDEISEKLLKLRPFLYYAIGAWTTAYARADIFNVLLDINVDAVYSDTDSAKIRNGDRYKWVFENFNNKCDERINAVCDEMNIDKKLFYPVSPKGVVQPLGHFAYEGRYKKFKSIGSKKYCYVDKDDNFDFVVAGLRKSYLYNNEKIRTMVCMEQMEKTVFIPHGRSVHWHCIDMPQTTVYDFNGIPYETSQKQGIAILSTCYTFNITDDYADFVLHIRNRYTNYFRTGWSE